MVSLSLAVPAADRAAVARRIDAKGGKPVLLASHLVLAAGLVIVGLAPERLGPGPRPCWCIGFGQSLGLSPTPFAILVSLYGEAARRPITGGGPDWRPGLGGGLAAHRLAGRAVGLARDLLRLGGASSC